MGFMPGPFELIMIGVMLLVPLALGFGLYLIVKAAVRSANREKREEE